MQQTESRDQLDLDLRPILPQPEGPFTTNNIVRWGLIAIFLGCIFIPSVYQTYYDMHVLGWSEFNDLFRKSLTADNLKDFENELIDGSRIEKWVRRTIGMAHGAELHKIITVPIIHGDDGFLFLKEEFSDYGTFSLLDPSPAPTANLVHAIEDYDRQLRKRGIKLVVLPVPLKTTIYPEKILPDYRASDGPANVPSYPDFLARLRQDGVDILDISPALWSAKKVYPEPIYIKDDAHWSWRGRGIAADVLAEHLKPMLVGCDQIQFDLVTAAADQNHDLRAEIGEDKSVADSDLTPLMLEGVYANGKPMIAGDEAPVLLLGDSYTSIGSDTGVSLAHDLMKRLHMGVQMFAWPGSGTLGGREELQKHPSALVKKRVVVWEFCARYLWTLFQDVPLPPATN